MEKAILYFLKYRQNLLKELLFKKEHKQCGEGIFIYVLCCSNENNLNHISCNVPRLNVMYLTFKKAHVEKKNTHHVFYAKE